MFDLWADQWRRRNARGDMILVRFADDYVAGFEHREDAERFLADLRGRFAEFGLELHPEKTRLIEFGRFAAERRERRGLRKPETFTFLGFTHICATNRSGAVQAEAGHEQEEDAREAQIGQDRDAQTDASPDPRTGTLARQRPARALQLLRSARQQRGHARLPTTGHLALAAALTLRSQKSQITWQRIDRLAARWLPEPRILHPWPTVRFDAKTRGRSPVR